MRDKNGDEVIVGDVVRLLQLPDVAYDAQQLKEVSTMLGESFIVESIEYECVQISKPFEHGIRFHRLFLWPAEFELFANSTLDACI